MTMMISGGAAPGIGSGTWDTGAEEDFYGNKLKGYMRNPSSFADDPGFKFALDTGRQAIERSAAARGMGRSGNTLAELMKFGTGLAFQHRGGEMDRLAGLSGREEQMGFARQEADRSALDRWLNYGLNKDKLSLDTANSQNNFNLGKFNANTGRGSARSRDWWQFEGA